MTLLDGVRVLDLSRILAGPWASQLLADLGAEVIKIERPGRGDDTRRWGPPFLQDACGDATDAAYFLAANRNKKSAAINIASPQGAKLIRELAAKSDIFIENFKVGGLKKYGLDYESLRTLNPKLVYCSITGFGQTGPDAPRAGYDYMIQAMGGLMSVTGQPDGAPGAEPMKVGVAVADLFSGLYASNAMIAALRHAERTGDGQHIDVALYDCQLAMLANQATNYLVSGNAPGRLGNAHPNISPYQVYQTKDAHLVLAVGNDDQFATFCRLANCAQMSEDVAFATNSARVANRIALNETLEPILRSRTTSDWLDALAEAGVPAGPINSVDQALETEQAKAREMTVALPRADAPDGRYVAHPIKYSKTPAQHKTAPPGLGAHTQQVLKELLALDDAAITALKDDDAI